MQVAMGANILTILVAAVAGWIFGALWYGVLGKKWMLAAGLDEKKIKGNKNGKPSPIPFITSFIFEFIMAYMLAMLFMHVMEDGLSLTTALGSAFLIWFGFVISAQTVNYSFSMRPMALHVIDGGHWLGVLLIQATVMSLMGL